MPFGFMRWLRRSSEEPLPVSMAGIKLADRLLIVGADDVALITTLAGKAGLTGRAVILDETDGRAQRTAAAVEREGGLVESFAAPFTSFPFSAAEFDVVVIRHVLPAIEAHRRAQVGAEAYRVLRPGGRCLVIDEGGRKGLAGVFAGGAAGGYGGAREAEPILTAAGFRGVRTLAEREGWIFVEGVKAGK